MKVDAETLRLIDTLIAIECHLEACYAQRAGLPEKLCAALGLDLGEKVFLRD